jgi:phosphate starvation-inducible PhoH-like protein
MRDPNRERKGEIKFLVQLNDEQKHAKNLIVNNQITVITGRAGSGKSLVAAQTSLDFLFKKMTDKIIVTRAMVEVEDDSMGFLPGNVQDKYGEYMEAFVENLEACYDRLRIQELIAEKKIIAGPVNFVRGKTINDILVIEEAQNLSKGKMLALLTRLGKTGKIIINGDFDQKDIKGSFTGLHYAKEISEKIDGIAYINLKENHRSDLVGKILDYEYGK